MNNWQYSRWVYQIGRTIKNKTLSPKQRNSFISFIGTILDKRPYLLSKIQIKKGTIGEISKQNDFALGKMIQVIGRNFNVIVLTPQEKQICDDFFYKTDARRYLTYNRFQVNYKHQQDFQQQLANLVPGDTLNMHPGNYESFTISVPNVTIIGQQGVIIDGDVIINAENVTVKNMQASNLIFNSSVKSDEITVDRLKADKVTFNSTADIVTVSNSIIGDVLIFNETLNDIVISGNTFNSSFFNAIIINGGIDGHMIVQGNVFN